MKFIFNLSTSTYFNISVFFTKPFPWETNVTSRSRDDYSIIILSSDSFLIYKNFEFAIQEQSFKPKKKSLAQ